MSGFVAATQGFQILGAHDLRLNRPDFQRQSLFVNGWSAVAPATFETEWWPKGGGFIGDGGSDVGLLAASWWGEYDPAAGASSGYGWVGVTRDVYGSALGGVSVFLFRTSDKTLIYSTTSDASGNYYVTTPYYPDAHFMVFQKTGSPDVQGASVFTLIGT